MDIKPNSARANFSYIPKHLKSASVFACFGLTATLASDPIEPGEELSFDHASDMAYIDGWQPADRGGTGWGEWDLGFYPTEGQDASWQDIYHGDAFFVDGIELEALPGNALGAPAFGISASNGTATATRPLTQPLLVGQTLHVKIDSSSLEGPGSIGTPGNAIQLTGSDGKDRLKLFTFRGYGDDQWISAPSDARTDVHAGAAFRLEFTLTEPDEYVLILRHLEAEESIFVESGVLSGTQGQPISQITLSAFCTGSSTDGSLELLFDDLVVTP